MNELSVFADNNLVQNADGVWCMSSLAIAELTGKEHKHVLRDIRKMLEELGKAAPEFSGTAFYTVNNNAQLTREIFNLPKRECLILVSGYNSVKMRAAIIDRWQILEDAEAERTAQALEQERETLARQQAALIRAAQAFERLQAALADDR